MIKTVRAFLLLFLSIFLCVSSVSNAGAAEFGPQKFIRVQGGTTLFSATFNSTPGAARLYIRNGEVVGEKRVDNVVSSARVLLNNKEIFSPNDFNKNVYVLEALVNLTDGINLINVELNGQPGTYITLQVTRPGVSVQAVPEIIMLGDSSVLSWSSTDAVSCTIAPGIGNVATSGSITLSPAESTTYTVTATDSQGLTATASQSITVNTIVNHLPEAVSAAVTTSEDTTADIVLTGNDPENDHLTYQVLLPPDHGNLHGTPPAISYVPFANYYGPDSFSFKVNDGTLDSEPAIISITVTPVNDRPVANAGSDQTVHRTDTVTLNGSGSIDIDNDSLTYQWSFLSVPTGSSAVISNPSSVSPSFVADAAGTYTIQLIVNDGLVNSVSDSLTVIAEARMIMVPDLAGLAQADAETVLTTAGLAIGAISTENSNSVAAGNVISQNPSPGIIVEENTPVSLVVSLGPLLPSVSLAANPTNIILGESSALSWFSSNADTVTIAPDIGTVAASGTMSVSPAATTTYTITAVGLGGTTTASIEVTVNPPTASSPLDIDFGTDSDFFQSGSIVGRSINILSGNAAEIRNDLGFPSPNSLGLSLTAVYNSGSDTSGPQGFGWSHTYTASLDPNVTFNSASYLKIIDESGRGIYFSEAAPGVYQGAFHEKTSVRLESGSYVWYREDGSSNGFSVSGRLLWIKDEFGNRLSLTYDSQNRLATVLDNATGRSLTFNYNVDGLLASISGPVTPEVADGIWVTYSYDANQNLVNVTYPDDSGFNYEYNDPVDIHNLTARSDKLGSVLNTWTYDAEDQAGGSTGLDGEGVTIHYLSDNQVSVTDAYGMERTYMISEAGGLNKVTAMQGPAMAPYSFNNLVRWAYDENGNLIEAEMAGGAIIQYENHDSRGNPLTVRLAVGTTTERVLSYTYHPFLNLPLTVTEDSILGAGNKVTVFDYDNDYDSIPNENSGSLPSRVIEQGSTRDLAGSTVSYEYVSAYTYNSSGQLTAIDGPLPGTGDTTTFTYDSVTKNLTSVTRPLIGTTYINDYDAAGRPGRITDVNGQSQVFTYDAKGRILSVLNDADSSTNSYTYTLAGQLETVIDPDNIQQYYDYDPATGRLSRTTDADGNYIAYVYDAQGNRTRMSKHDPTGSRTDLKNWNYQHPAIPGLLYQEINANGSFTAYNYDEAGNVSQMTDPEGHTTVYEYDALNRPTMTTQPGNVITFYYYDTQGDLVMVIDPNNNATSYEYDDLGRLVYQNSSDTGPVSFVYDEAGNLIYKTDANGITTQYSYDALNRQTAVSYPDPVDNIIYTYDQGLYGIGRLTGLSDASGGTFLGYDARGRLTDKNVVINGISFDLGRAFTPGGRVETITLPTGRTVDYSMNTVGKAAGVTSASNSVTTTLMDIPVYRPFSGPTAMTTGAGAAINNEYGECGCGVQIANPGAPYEMVYSYDNNKNLLGIDFSNKPWLSLSYTYDPLNRLIAASGPFGDAAYSYDNVGNRLSQTVNIFTETYTYQPNTNRLAAVSGQTNESYSYNAVGSIIVIDSKFLKYNQDNRLTRFIDASGANAITADFTYNAYGQRVSKSSNLYAGANIYLYDFDGNIIAEADETGNIFSEYLYMGSNRLAKVDTASGNIYFYINDRLGTPIMMVDATNTVVWEATYKPFGEADVNPGSTVENNFRFPGQYYDIETGMHYNWHRYYDPSTGRYLTPDPIGLAGGINPYLYTGANPVNFIDPFGLFESPWYLSWVPGQHMFDLGMTAIETGQYGWAAAYFGGMLGEQALSALTLGQGQVAGKGAQCSINAANDLVPSLDDLARTAAAADKGGFTAAGRSLTKHGAGARTGNSLFPPATGNPFAINNQAQNIVKDILANPGTKVINSHRGRFGNTIEYIAPDGRGVVFDANGKFLFFREGGL